jgi:16S rRNA (cytidine1402-2'-O)-methyltransferase
VQVLALVTEGSRLKEAATEVAEATGLSRRDLYEGALAARKGEGRGST